MTRAIGRFSRVVAGAAVVLAIAAPAHAQGNSGNHGNGNGNGKKSQPPSSTPLPSPIAGPASGATPVAWLDGASLLTPGSMTLTVGAVRWSGTDLSEVDVPVIDVSVGVAPRFQLSGSVTRVVAGAADTGPVGGLGTSYVSGKIAVLNGTSDLKVAVAPTVEILGEGAAQALPPGEHRTRLGLPVNVELSHGTAHVFASAGFFSGDAWFFGGGVALQATPKVSVSGAFTRAWASDPTTAVTIDRRELTGAASYLVTPQMEIYGSLGRTIATTDASGAGTTLGGGVTFLLSQAVRSPH